MSKKKEVKKKVEEDEEENIIRIYKWINKDDFGIGYHIMPMDADVIESALVELELVKQKLLADYVKLTKLTK